MTIKRITTTLLAITAILAINVITATSASAAAPEFSPGGFLLFNIDSGLGILSNNTTNESFHCESDLGHGFITGPHTVGLLLVTFHGCIAIKGTESCPGLSPGGTPGLIHLHFASGELGTVKTSEATSGVALLLKPETGTEFVVLEGKCVTTAAVSGSVAGEVTPVSTSVNDGKVIFTATGPGVQKIKAVNLLGEAAKPKLTAFAGLIEASEETSELILFNGPVEVT
jgi:hypothetical protein